MANMTSMPGRACKVTLGANNVLGMGTWELGGGSTEELDTTEFGNDFSEIQLGITVGGNASFSGIYKKNDTQGQDLIKQAFYYKSDLTTLRFYVDSVSYFTPNSTTLAGGGLPAESQVSYINIISEPSIAVDMAGLVTISFTGKVSGVMRFI
jgi:hypothetical protein